MRILVCGSREFADPFGVSLSIDAGIADLPDGCEILHGGARGADAIAGEAAKRHGHTVRVFRADWKKHGKRAGIIRNLQMLDENPDAVIAYWNGKSTGTAHTILEASRRGIPVKVIAAA